MQRPSAWPSARSLVNLLRSNIGQGVLNWILGDNPPAWRAEELRLIAIAQLELKLTDQKKQLEDLRKQVGA